MLEYISKNRTALIVLHEIYGVNDFVKDCCQQYHKEGYDVFCPDLFCNQAVFPYSKAKEAYSAYMSRVGFDAYQKIDAFASKLKRSYTKVVVIGFSVGATLAWRCSESPLYDAIVCCYGSRIRDYLTINPQCPTLLIFARQDSFDVTGTALQVCDKRDAAVKILDDKHGFADCYNENYNESATVLFNKLRQDFLTACTIGPLY